MSKVLVVYYSRSGNTRQVAEAVATAFDADIEAIVDKHPRHGLLGYLRSGLEATLHSLADIEPPKHDPLEYDLVVLGTPIWDASLSAPMRTFLTQQRGRFRGEVAFFCTCGSSGGERVLRQMTMLTRDPAATLVLREAELHGDGLAPKIERFVREAREMRVEPPQPMGPTPPTATAPALDLV